MDVGYLLPFLRYKGRYLREKNNFHLCVFNVPFEKVEFCNGGGV